MPNTEDTEADAQTALRRMGQALFRCDGAHLTEMGRSVSSASLEVKLRLLRLA